MRYIALTLSAALFPLCAFAAGTDDTAPPASPACTNGQIYDVSQDKCITPKSNRLDDQMRYQAVREYAYDGQYKAALTVLDAMQDQQADGVLAYRGYIARHQGKIGLAMQYYTAALSINPDNMLVRSYMGQGLVTQGDVEGARAQLAEIRARGGAGSWAETSLATAIETGTTYRY